MIAAAIGEAQTTNSCAAAFSFNQFVLAGRRGSALLRSRLELIVRADPYRALIGGEVPLRRNCSRGPAAAFIIAVVAQRSARSRAIEYGRSRGINIWSDLRLSSPLRALSRQA